MASDAQRHGVARKSYRVLLKTPMNASTRLTWRRVLQRNHIYISCPTVDPTAESLSGFHLNLAQNDNVGADNHNNVSALNRSSEPAALRSVNFSGRVRSFDHLAMAIALLASIRRLK